MSTTISIDNLFRYVGDALMLLGGKGNIEWTTEGEEPITMTIPEFVRRSLAEVLLEDGVEKKDIETALEKVQAGPTEYPDGEPYGILVKSVGGQRRKTRRNKRKS